MSRTMPPVEGSEAEDWMPVRISREVAAELFVRDKDGRRLTWDFGQPDADGFYTPTITTSEDEWFEARQQGRDRDYLPLIEAAELVLAARDSVGLEAMPVDLWAAIDTLRFGLKAVGRRWTGDAGPQVRGGG